MKQGTVFRIVKGGFIFLIHLYQHTLSFLFGPSCRFTPSCSSYALGSIQRFGTLEGIWLTVRRLVKCHPFHPGGYDPVPDNLKKS